MKNQKEIFERLDAINDQLRRETGVSKSQVKRGFKRLYPVMPRNKTGRNEPCVCGSGKKFKHCCI